MITRTLERTDSGLTATPDRLRSQASERGLLVLAGVFIGVNALALGLVRGALDFTPFAVWIACAAVGHAVLNARLPDRDSLLFPLGMFMSGWGLILIERLAPAFADRQTLWLILATGGMIAAAWTSRIFRWMRAYRYTLLFGGLIVLALTIRLGTNPSDPEGIFGAPTLWLSFGDLFFQPSEALKIVLVVFLASYLGEQYPALRAEGIEHQPGGTQPRGLSLSPRLLGPMLLMWGISVVVLVWQRDLGTAILFFIVFLTLLYVASGYTALLLSGAGLIIAAGFAAYQLFDVVRLRIDIWLNPWLEADGRAYQIVQSLMAFAAGGVFGQGIGQGAPLFIPVTHSDFVFAAIAEEWGFIGVMGVVACQSIFIARGLRTASAPRGKPFHTLLAVGLSSVIGTQTLLIMAGVLKIIPLTGVTLPFISYGGSSLLVTFIMLGLLLRLSSRDAA